ncbi:MULTISPECIES: DUF2380 domain-containing protein [unclassified Methylobacterium]|uniref:DUF2380 domain-containing protein n=1 Tax=unclassified Methylobacterium TaxID=2615210 RepID=UPI000AB494A2|nr:MULTISPECIES: DUF2380 domain-containing protein [unclassified Methylobacterium]
MRTIHRSRTVALGVGIALLLGALPCSADPAPNLAMLPIRMLDTSGEPKDQTSEHAARLAAMAQGLSARLSTKGCFRVAGIDAEALARSCPGNEPACILGVARANGAGLAFVGVIHKSSTLIMQMFARIVETGGGATIFSRELNFRGDNDESWQRAEVFLAREIEDDRPGGQNATTCAKK